MPGRSQFLSAHLLARVSAVIGTLVCRCPVVQKISQLFLECCILPFNLTAFLVGNPVIPNHAADGGLELGQLCIQYLHFAPGQLSTADADTDVFFNLGC